MEIRIKGVAGAGKFAIVSPEDYPELVRYSWYYRDGYALAKIAGKEVRMHRHIMRHELASHPDSRDLVVDHKDRNRLNNQRDNLRVFDPLQNANNRSDNVRIECFGESKTIAEWSRDPRYEVSYSVLRGRLRRGIETWAAILAPKK